MPDRDAPILRLQGNGKRHPDKPTLTIVLEGPNAVSVSGPLKDRIISYGMLDLARDLISDMHRKKQDGGAGVEAATPDQVPPT